MKTRFHLVLLSLIVACCFVILYAGNAHAQTGTGPGNRPPPLPAPLLIEHVVDIPYGHGVWTPEDNKYHQAVQVPQFNPVAGQRLRGVTVKYTSYLATDLVVENTNPNGGCMWKWDLEAHVALRAPTGTLVAEEDVFDSLRLWRLGAFDGTVDGFGASGRSETRVGVGAEDVTQLAGVELLQFIGPGVATFDLERWGKYTYSATTANAAAGHNRRTAGHLVVQYLVQ